MVHSTLIFACSLATPSVAQSPPRSVPGMSDASQSVPKDSVITIGHAGPLTGTIGHLGVDNENGC